MNYARRIKEILWPHFLVPLALLVLLDYAVLLSYFARFLAVGYITFSMATLVVGFWSGMAVRINEETAWRFVPRLNFSRVFPLTRLGFAYARWLLAERDDDTPALASAEPSGETANGIEQRGDESPGGGASPA